jgi:hypothetical protein
VCCAWRDLVRGVAGLRVIRSYDGGALLRRSSVAVVEDFSLYVYLDKLCFCVPALKGRSSRGQVPPVVLFVSPPREPTGRSFVTDQLGAAVAVVDIVADTDHAAGAGVVGRGGLDGAGAA